MVSSVPFPAGDAGDDLTWRGGAGADEFGPGPVASGPGEPEQVGPGLVGPGLVGPGLVQSGPVNDDFLEWGRGWLVRVHSLLDRLEASLGPEPDPEVDPVLEGMGTALSRFRTALYRLILSELPEGSVQQDALRLISERGDGEVHLLDAVPALRAVGLTRAVGDRKLARSLGVRMSGSGEFIRVGEFLYRRVIPGVESDLDSDSGADSNSGAGLGSAAVR